MIIANPGIILIRFGEIRPFSLAKIGRPQPPLGREVRQIILSRVADIGAVGLMLLKPFGLRELYLLVLILEIGVAIRFKK